MNYDPNLTTSGRMARQTVRLRFQQWNYKAELEAEVGGNCTGLDVISCAVGNAYESLPRLYADVASIELKDAEGNTLECSDDEDQGEDWLKDMLVGAEIVAIEPES